MNRLIPTLTLILLTACAGVDGYDANGRYIGNSYEYNNPNSYALIQKFVAAKQPDCLEKHPNDAAAANQCVLNEWAHFSKTNEGVAAISYAETADRTLASQNQALQAQHGAALLNYGAQLQSLSAAQTPAQPLNCLSRYNGIGIATTCH